MEIFKFLSSKNISLRLFTKTNKPLSQIITQISVEKSSKFPLNLNVLSILTQLCFTNCPKLINKMFKTH